MEKYKIEKLYIKSHITTDETLEQRMFLLEEMKEWILIQHKRIIFTINENVMNGQKKIKIEVSKGGELNTIFCYSFHALERHLFEYTKSKLMEMFMKPHEWVNKVKLKEETWYLEKNN